MEPSFIDQVNRLFSDPERAPMDLSGIVTEEVREFKRSPAYARMREADAYYRNRSAVQGKRVGVRQRSTVKIERPILKKLIDQKVNYLLSKPWTVDTASPRYGEALGELFDEEFRGQVRSLAKGAIQAGIGFLQPYFEDGVLKLMRIPADELVPFWEDAGHTRMAAFIRFYDQVIYAGRKKQLITHAEFWWGGGVKFFRTLPFPFGGSGLSQFFPDPDHGGEDGTLPHFTIDGVGYNWERPPAVWLKYNDEELPLNYFVRDLIDDINWQNSVTADTLRDIAQFIFVLTNYGGEDLGEFVKDLRDHLAIKVDGDGGVEKLQADLNIDAVMKFLDNERRDLFDFAAAVDTKDPDLGNASGTAINFRYMDLDADCMSLGTEMQGAFRQLKPFIDTALQLSGKGDFSGESFRIVFNADMPVNETDVINNARNSDGLISRRTILENHPWVTDVDEEIAQMDAEKRESMESFGEGLFDARFGNLTGGPDAEE